MTTIVYDHKNKTISWDSRQTSNGGEIKSDKVKKHHISNGVHFWIAGAVCDQDLMIQHYLGESPELVPECNCIAFDDGKVYRCGVNEQAIFWKELLTHNDGFGSGREWALAALDFGLSSKDAVKYATKKDAFSGGKIHTMELK
ncbi:hypothetical protein NVP1197A_07 [Vibrio phage 1.197.A._10N.286.54.F2]|nr:hypothetical protein NVP1197A_07 [Vibrio phage 1.197.A._10N.286.54.F2]